MAQVREIGTAGVSAADGSRSRLGRRSVAAGAGILLVAAALTVPESTAVAGPVATGAAVTVVSPAAATPTIPTLMGREFWLVLPPMPRYSDRGAEYVPVDQFEYRIFSKDPGSMNMTCYNPSDPTKFTGASFGLSGGTWYNWTQSSQGMLPQPSPGVSPIVHRFGCHVESTVDASIYMMSFEPKSRVGFAALPVSSLGTHYRVLSYTAPHFNVGDWGSYVVVLATENDTEVTLTRPDGQTESVTLDQGDSFAYTPPTYDLDEPWQVSNSPWVQVSDESDATGIEVTSNKPIGVYSGAWLAAIPYNKNGLNPLSQMLPPTSAWGTEFFAVRLGTRLKGDRYKVLADQDDTEVRVNGSLVDILDAGEAYEFVYPMTAVVAGAQSLQITTSKPTLVGQFGTGVQNEFASEADAPIDYYADPLFMLIPPRQQYLDSYYVSLPDLDNAQPGEAPAPGIYWVNLVVPTEAISSVRLNGAAVPASKFKAIGRSPYSGAQISVPTAGSYSVTADEPFGMHAYAWGLEDSIGFSGGMSMAPIGNVASVVLDDPTVSGSGKSGSYPEAEVTVEDADGDAVAGVPVTFEVTDAGENDQVVTDVTDAQGVASAEFPGTAPESGTLTVDAGAIEVDGTITWGSTGSRVPTAPQLTITPKDGALLATWKRSSSSGSSAITQYKIVAVPGGEFCTVTPKAGQKDFSCSVTGLTNKKPYSLESYARNSAGWSEKDTFGPKSPAAKPSKPRGLSVVSKSADGTLVIQWDEPADDGGARVTNYDVLWRLRDATKYTTKPKVRETTHTITGLRPGARYRVAVAARNVIGRGQESFFIVRMPS